MNGMLDLFDPPVVAGFAMRGDIISNAEEAALIAQIDGTRSHRTVVLAVEASVRFASSSGQASG